MHRRRFLRYAAAGAAIAGSALAGYEFSRWQASLVPPSVSTVTKTHTVTQILNRTVTQTVTQTLSETTTEIVKLSSLHGRLFFDYNGNGIQDAEEPAVPNARVHLTDSSGKIIADAVTDSSGDYNLQDVHTGTYTLYVEPDEKFRYMCTSPEELRVVKEGYHALLNESNKMDIGLMEGFLTLPLLPKTRYSIGRFYDWDSSRVTYLWWNGQRGSERSHGGSINHPGIDYDVGLGTPILSAAPGYVSHIAVIDGVKYVNIDHGHGWKTSYDHIFTSSVELFQRVARGQEIAKSGESGTYYPHLHFDLRSPDSRCVIDPYSPVFDVSADMNGYLSIVATGKTLWVADPLEIHGNGKGYFTKRNDPQYSS